MVPNSYFTEKGHFFHIFFVQYHVMCLLFQMSCGEQLKRSNVKTSFVNRLNNSRCVESGRKTLDLPKSGPGFLPEVVVRVCINTADCF